MLIVYEEEVGVTFSKNRYENKVCLNLTTTLLRYNILINCNRRFDCSRDFSGDFPGLPRPVAVCSESKPPLEVIISRSKCTPVLSETISVQSMCCSSNYQRIKTPIQHQCKMERQKVFRVKAKRGNKSMAIQSLQRRFKGSSVIFHLP